MLARRVLFACLGFTPLVLQAQRPFRPDTVALQQILTAEDARGHGANGVTPLITAINGTDTMLRRVAARGIGRLQRPDLGRQLAPLLADPVPGVRAEAANAIAQAVSRARRRPDDAGQPDVKWAADVLMTALASEQNAVVADAMSEALGRLPFGESTLAQLAEAAILAHGGMGFGAMHGLYSLAANASSTGGLTRAATARLREATMPFSEGVVRRIAVLALGISGALDSATVFAAANDPDEQVRRLALGGMRTLSPLARGMVLRKGLSDPSAIVRIAAVPLARAGVPVPDCSPIIAATSDAHPYVALTAIDALNMPCADSTDAAAALERLTDRLPPDAARGWQLAAHALVSLARTHPALARPHIGVFAASPGPGPRIYAARAASFASDTAVLYRLARDTDHNVREAAIAGLAHVVRHDADSIYVAALASSGYQVVLAAAAALNGAPAGAALPALFDCFDRLSRERRENARDPRIAVLGRIGTMGSRANSAHLAPYLADFDSTVADTVARILSRWTGAAVAAHPALLQRASLPLAQTFLSDVSLRVTMAAAAGGGVFTIRLFTSEAPATSARMLQLARNGSRSGGDYFAGHVFQRVEPDFVVQGGGPDANEYVGDAEFMRDEVGPRSQLRGTLGISSRGRDTGDAQWFFNLIDNTRLDHEYTVFGEVASGLDVVERILEGDAIAHVEVVTRH